MFLKLTFTIECGKPLTDARLYGHKDICRILEVNGGKDAKNKKPLVIRFLKLKLVHFPLFCLNGLAIFECPYLKLMAL